jgi:hypothetical protein
MARTRWPSDLGTPASCTGQADQTGSAGGCKELGPADRSISRQPERHRPIRRSGRDPGLRPYARTRPKPRKQGQNHNPHPPCRVCAGDLACTRAASAAPNSRLWSPADGGGASSTSTSAQPSRILPGAAVHLGSVSHLEFVPVEIVCGRHMSACVQCISRLDLLVEDNHKLVICSFSLRLSQGIASLCEDAISPLFARVTFSATRRRVCG